MSKPHDLTKSQFYQTRSEIWTSGRKLR